MVKNTFKGPDANIVMKISSGLSWHAHRYFEGFPKQEAKIFDED